eukprot:765301-Hanusia_phi.AAC.2
MVVTGDHWSFLLHIQFVSITSLLSTEVPQQYIDWASSFRPFNAQLDPKDVAGWLGYEWPQGKIQALQPWQKPNLPLCPAAAAAAAVTTTYPSPAAHYQHLIVIVISVIITITFTLTIISSSSCIILTGSCRIYQNISAQLDTNSTTTSLEEVAVEESFRLFLGTVATSAVLIFLVSCARILAARLRVLIIRWKRRRQKVTQMAKEDGGEEEDEEGPNANTAAEEGKITVQVSGEEFGLPFRRSAKGHRDEGKEEGEGGGKGGSGEAKDEKDGHEDEQGAGEEGQEDQEEEEEETIPISMVLRFPKWELPVLVFLSTGLSTSTGMLVNAAISARCFPLLGFVVVLAACILFVIWLFFRLRKHFISRPAVWWHRNRLEDAEQGLAAARQASSRQFRHKCLADYMDALQTSGWWEDAVGIKKEEEAAGTRGEEEHTSSGLLSDQVGKKLEVSGEEGATDKGSGEIEQIVRTVMQEAALVPALYLRSKEGNENAQACSTFDDFLLTARDRLKLEAPPPLPLSFSFSFLPSFPRPPLRWVQDDSCLMCLGAGKPSQTSPRGSLSLSVLRAKRLHRLR